MKFNLNNGNVTLTSETQEEALRLFTIATEAKQKGSDSSTKCNLCGKSFLNLKAIAVHRRKSHGIKVKNSDKNHRYYLKWKMKHDAEKAGKEMQNIWK